MTATATQGLLFDIAPPVEERYVPAPLRPVDEWPGAAHAGDCHALTVILGGDPRDLPRCWRLDHTPPCYMPPVIGPDVWPAPCPRCGVGGPRLSILPERLAEACGCGARSTKEVS